MVLKIHGQLQKAQNNMNTKNTILLRKMVYSTIGLLGSLISIPKITIFCYHGISDSGWRFDVTGEDFEKQIKYLKTRYKLVSLPEIHEYLSNNKRITKPLACITFDDGYKDVLKIQEFCKAEKIYPTVFVLSNPKLVNRKEIDNNKELLSDKDIKSLIKYGWTIGSHGATHENFKSLTYNQIVNEVDKSKKMLEKSLGLKIDYFAYPKGSYSQAIVNQVSKSGYKLAVSMDPGILNMKSDKFTLPRVGVDGSHSFTEFVALPNPITVLLRKLSTYTPLSKSII